MMMSIKCKKIGRCVFITVFSFFLMVSSGWSQENIPLPDDTIKVQEKGSDVGQMPFNMVLYRTAMPVAKLNAFFLQAMKEAGWTGGKEKDGALVFRKEQEIVFIVVVPPRKAGSLTQFTVSTAITPTEKELSATKKDKPDKLSFMPLYPDAKQTLLMDLPGGGVSAGYSTNDTIESVLFFYKAQMLKYEWVLVEEKPIEAVPIDCPNCKKGMQDAVAKFGGASTPQWEPKGVSKRATLFFQRSKGEACVINVMMQELENVPPEYAAAKQEKTIIMVTYNDARAM